MRGGVRKYRTPGVQKEVRKSSQYNSNTRCTDTYAYDWTSGLLNFRTSNILDFRTSRLLQRLHSPYT